MLHKSGPYEVPGTAPAGAAKLLETIKKTAENMGMRDNLPDHYKQMNETMASN